jgi:hypothetical protein
MLIQSPVIPVAGKEDKEDSSAESGKVLQNPQQPRNSKIVRTEPKRKI